ncbi:MAG TPA: DUF2911 domain-containing protein [Chitinophagaceae bacterium]|nr:DUF2911 domain-containing protein [Chitinophagaceae bacterium]
MKTFISFICLATISIACNNQNKEPITLDLNENDSLSIKPNNVINPFDPIDISPMDMSYFPEDYPQKKMSKETTDLPKARIIYSRPHLAGRRLFVNLLKYGEPWRLGANEATEIDFYKSVTILSKKFNPGRYVLYCIPEKDNWTIVFNSNIDSWGLHPDASKDIDRFTIPITMKEKSQEYLTIYFDPTKTGADLVMRWGFIEARLPISF